MIYDPWANADEVKHEYGIDILNTLDESRKYDVVILGVAHSDYLKLNIKSLVKDNGVVYDVKGILGRDVIDGRL